MGHFLQVFFIEEKEQARKPGKEDADGGDEDLGNP